MKSNPAKFLFSRATTMRAGIVKIGGVNPVKYNFVYLKRNLLTINIML